MQLPETNCARARESVSAQLDGELAELERERLEAHLLVCPDCSAWAEEVRDVTRRLRDASLEEPAAIGLSLPRRRRTRTAAPVALVAAAAASLMAVLGSSHSLTVGSGQPGSSHVSPQVTGAPAVIGLENARLGLYSLPPRASVAVPHGRFHAV